MKKLLISICSLILVTPAFADMSVEEAFLTSIHICKDKELYKQGEKELKGTEEWAAINCFCDNFKEYTEAEIFQKYEMAMDYEIPQYDLYISLKKAINCVEGLNK